MIGQIIEDLDGDILLIADKMGECYVAIEADGKVHELGISHIKKTFRGDEVVTDRELVSKFQKLNQFKRDMGLFSKN